MLKTSKKIISLILCLTIIFSFSSLCFAENEEEYPIVVIYGYGEKLLNEQGEEIFPLKSDVVTEFIKNTIKLDEKYFKGVFNGDFGPYSEELYHTLTYIYDDIRLDNNGEPSNGSHLKWSYNPDNLKKKTSDYTVGEYGFRFDWRLDPCENAKLLDKYIDAVLAATGKTKVRLFGRCEGCCVAQAYITDFGYDKLDTVMYYIPAVCGVTVISKLFTGDITLDPDAVDDFASYYLPAENLLGDENLTTLVISLVTILNRIKALGLLVDFVESVYDIVYNSTLPKIIRDTYGTFPGFWCMIGDEYYEDAKAFVFGDSIDEYAGLIEKIDYYHYNVQVKTTEKLDEIQKNGVNFGNIAKYNVQAFPVYDGCDAQGDSTGELDELSFGATSGKLGEYLSDEYIAEAEKNGTAKYISPDKIVDASTCLYRDKTWFIKDCPHSKYPANINDLILAFLKSGGEMTVFDDENYPQYFNYDTETKLISPQLKNDDVPAVKDSTLKVLLKFLTSFVNVIKNYLQSLTKTKTEERI